MHATGFHCKLTIVLHSLALSGFAGACLLPEVGADEAHESEHAAVGGMPPVNDDGVRNADASDGSRSSAESAGTRGELERSSAGTGGDGDVGAARCIASARECKEGRLLVCRAPGEMQVAESCPHGCSDVEAACRQCEPGVATCTFNQSKVCRADGEGFDLTECQDGCDAEGVRCLSCAAGERNCLGQCFARTDAQHCGERCEACPDFGVYGKSSCDGTQCRIACSDGAIACQRDGKVQSCNSNRLGFEDQLAGVMVPGIVTGRAHSGLHSLKMERTYAFSFCTEGTSADLVGKVAEAWVYADPEGRTVDQSASCSLGFRGDVAGDASPPVEIPLDQWTRLTTTAKVSRASGVDVSCSSPFAELSIFVDDFAIR